MTNANDHDHDNYNDDDGFSGTLQTVINPGLPLGLATFGYCVFIYFVSWVWIMKKRRVDRAISPSSSSSSPKQRRRSNPTEDDIKDVVKLSSYVAYGNKDYKHASPSDGKPSVLGKAVQKARAKQKEKEGSDKQTDRRGGAGHKKIFGVGGRRKASAYDAKSVLTFKNLMAPCFMRTKPRKITDGQSCAAAYGCSDYDPMEEIGDTYEMMFLDESMSEIHRLAGPW